MNVWWAIPSARPVDEARKCFDAWRSIGCKLAATRKDPADRDRLGLDLCISLPTYSGYYRHINILVRAILDLDPKCSIVVTGGDDVYPDPDWPAAKVEAEFLEHFGGTLGVMQPTGGRPWSHGLINGLRVQERLAWAPWLGREYCIRGYGGTGPFWPEQFQYFGDEELFEVANLLGIWWANPAIKQEHHNWKTYTKVRPEFLNRAQSNWDSDKAIFVERKAAGFPGHELRPF